VRLWPWRLTSGQGGEDMEVVCQRALDCGAVEGRRRRRARRIRRGLLPAHRLEQRAVHGPHPLVSAISRPLIAKHLVAAAREHGGKIVAHGLHGKGNDPGPV